MMDFMVISLPRSASTWMANWLTTDTTVCIHDPLYQNHYHDFDQLSDRVRSMMDKTPGLVGVSCTGLYHFPDWLNTQMCPKVIIHRDIEEINKELKELGIPQLDERATDLMHKIHGMHVPYSSIFDFSMARKIWAHLLRGRTFQSQRFAVLRDMMIQPAFDRIHINPQVTRRMMDEMAAIGKDYGIDFTKKII